MSKYKTGKELIQEWKIKDFELLEHVKTGLQPYNQFGRPIPPPDISAKLDILNMRRRELATFLRYHWPDLPSVEEMKKNPASAGAIMERERLAPHRKSLLDKIENLEKELKLRGDKNSWAAYELPDDKKSAQGVIDLLQNALFKGELNTDQEEDKPNIYAELGRKGGKAPKMNGIILKAVIQYLRDTPLKKVSGKSNEEIAMTFCKKFKEESAMSIDYEGYKWEVYCYEKKIYSRCSEPLGKNKPKDEEKSIACSTFKKSYIPKAKENLSVSEILINHV